MPTIDRDGLIALLDQLDDPADDRALAAARAVSARLKESGMTWEALLAPAAPVLDDAAETDDDTPGHIHAGPPGDETMVGSSDAAPVDAGADLALIDRLLAGQTLSEDTRAMLTDMKDDVRDGNFTAGDRHYLRSLETRLGKGGTRKR